MVCNSLSLLPFSSPPSLPSTSDSFNSFTTSFHPRLHRITPRRQLRAFPVEFQASFAKRPVKEDDDDGEGTTSAAKFAENNSIADFMRFKRGGSGGGDKGNGELQTAVVSYRKKFPWSLLWPFLQVDLVSTIHIADKEYFSTIQRELELYDCVLYEMVASRESLENRMNYNSSKRHQSSRYRGFNILGFIQRQMARILTLDFQLDCLDYQSENWYHADLDFETFKLLQQEKGESFFSFARDMTLRSTKAMIQSASVPEDLSPWRSKLLWASRVLPMPLVGLLIIVSVCADPGSPTSEYPELEALSRLDFGAAMKVFLARRLTSEFKLVTADVEEKSVIIGERNRAAIDELRRAIDNGYRRIAILYGGGHMPDLGRRLREEFDLVPTQVQWITAWSITNRNTKLSQVPLLQKMAELSGWTLNRYQTLALFIFSSVLAIDLWFWELFFGTAVSWVSQLATEVAFYLDNLQGVDQSLLYDPLLLQDHNNGRFQGDVHTNKKTSRFETRGDDHDPEIYEVAGGGNPSRLNRYALWGSILASTNSVLLGYDIGVMSGAILYIREDMKITSAEVEVLVGSLNVVSLLGSLAAGRTSDTIGRRLTILLASVTFLVGAVLMGLAPSFPFLIAGRLVAGVGVGYALMIAPVYAAEISPATTRGFMSSLPEVFINVGILLGYVSNYALSGLPSDINWRLMLGLASLPAVVIGFGIMSMPESPRWLVMEGRLEEARRVLVKISESEEDAESRLSEMVNYASFSSDNHPSPGPCQWTGQGIWKELLWKPSRPIRRILAAAIGINFFMQASGNDAVIYYSPEVFRKAGISNHKHLVGVTVIMGFVKTFFVLVSAMYLDRFGRRPLLLVGSIGIAVSLFGLGLGSKFLELSGSDKPGWVIGMCVVAVCADVSFFSIGLGPVTWVYSSEIFPTRLRAQGTSLAISVNRLVSGAVSMSFLTVSKQISFGVMFVVLSGIMGLAALFIYFCLPETKGKSLEEIEALFEDKQ